MTKNFFYKEVDTTDRQAMLDYLKNHEKYSGHYAHNVKIYNLGLEDELNEEQADTAWKVISNQGGGRMELEMDTLSDDFENITGYDFGLGGHLGGHLVMYDAKYPNRNTADDVEELKDWDTDELKERVETIQTFDKYADYLRDSFIEVTKQQELEDRVNATLDKIVPKGGQVDKTTEYNDYCFDYVEVTIHGPYDLQRAKTSDINAVLNFKDFDGSEQERVKNIGTKLAEKMEEFSAEKALSEAEANGWTEDESTTKEDAMTGLKFDEMCFKKAAKYAREQVQKTEQLTEAPKKTQPKKEHEQGFDME